MTGEGENVQDSGDASCSEEQVIEKAVLEYLKTHSTVKPSDIVDEVPYSRQAVSRMLKRLGAEGVLEKIPSSKGYVVWQLPDRHIRERVSLLCDGFRADLKSTSYIPLHAKLSGRKKQLLDGVVEEWILSGGRLLVLLGDYGSGKTLYSKHLYVHRAGKYLEDPSAARIPVLIQLKRLRSDNDQLADLIDRRLYGSIPSNEEIHRLNAQGRVLFILDGFDEMVMNTGSSKPHKNFQMLNDLFMGNSKIILTSRTAFFKKQVEEEKACSIPNPTYTGLLHQTEESQIVYLSDFNSKDIDTYFQLFYGPGWRKNRKQMNNIYDLSDLAKRPILLNVICKTLPKLAEKDVEINILEIYTAYVDMWLEREKWKDINEDDVRQFMMELALYISKNGDYEIHYKELKRLISKSLSDRLFSYSDLEDFDLKIRTCSFLHRDPEGNYSFIHRSFMEYFVALGVREVFDTGGDAEQLEKVLAGVHLSGAVEQFLHGMQIKHPDMKGWLLIGSVSSGNP